jgi:poly(3-hydroxyoctanoate) depolymerase
VSAPSPDPAISFVDVEDVRLRTSVRGAGSPVLLITGLGASLELGRPFEDRMVALGHRVISFDAPGVGRSSTYRIPRRMPGIARTVHGMLSRLGYTQVDVIGVSLGGVVAQQLAHQSPDTVRRLVLAATGAGLGGIPGSPRALFPLITPRRYRDPGYYRRIAGRIYGGGLRQNPAAFADVSLPQLDATSTLGYAHQLYAISGWTSLPWLHHLPQPTLVLHGDDDPIVPAVNARILARRIPDSRLEIVRGGGHLFLLERPAESARLIAGFLEANRPPNGV